MAHRIFSISNIGCVLNYPTVLSLFFGVRQNSAEDGSLTNIHDSTAALW